MLKGSLIIGATQKYTTEHCVPWQVLSLLMGAPVKYFDSTSPSLK